MNWGWDNRSFELQTQEDIRDGLVLSSHFVVDRAQVQELLAQVTQARVLEE